MQLLDVNVLVYAHRADVERHDDYRRWIEQLWASGVSYGVSDLVLSGCLRVLTHPRVFDPPSSLETALAFIEQVGHHPNGLRLQPGQRYWRVFRDLVNRCGARGNVVPDAYLAALAIEHGAEFVTTDRGFARFPGLRWKHPLE